LISEARTQKSDKEDDDTECGRGDRETKTLGASVLSLVSRDALPEIVAQVLRGWWHRGQTANPLAQCAIVFEQASAVCTFRKMSSKSPLVLGGQLAVEVEGEQVAIATTTMGGHQSDCASISRKRRRNSSRALKRSDFAAEREMPRI